MSAPTTAHGSPLTAHALGLRFGEPASIGIARRAAAVAGLVDHIAAEHTFPVKLPCVDCGGSGKCEDCNGSGECPECHDVYECSVCSVYGECNDCFGSGDCDPCGGEGFAFFNYERSELIDALHAAPVDRLADICRHFEYQPQHLGSPFTTAHRSPLTAHGIEAPS